MVVGFVNAGIMTLGQAVGVIMGANIGTTMTAFLISLNLTDVAPIIVFIGVGLIFFSKRKFVKSIGEIPWIRYLIYWYGVYVQRYEAAADQ